MLIHPTTLECSSALQLQALLVSCIVLHSNLIYLVCLQVSSNGLISFRIQFTSFLNEDFSDRFSFTQESIIAPLWTDLIITRYSRLYIRVSKEPSDLALIANLVANATMDNTYHPLTALVVTWENVSLLGDFRITVSGHF